MGARLKDVGLLLLLDLNLGFVLSDENLDFIDLVSHVLVNHNLILARVRAAWVTLDSRVVTSLNVGG